MIIVKRLLALIELFFGANTLFMVLYLVSVVMILRSKAFSTVGRDLHYFTIDFELWVIKVLQAKLMHLE
ncbi:MAG: hypothetical protein OXC64_05540 [Flavobacteriaceae bacterium]|nr:hypothetical protein [Flavobacteriaceae bacterium]